MEQKLISLQHTISDHVLFLTDTQVKGPFEQLIAEYLGLAEGLFELKSKLTLINTDRFVSLMHSRPEWSSVVAPVLASVIDHGRILQLEQGLSLLFTGSSALLLLPSNMLSFIEN